MNFNILSRPIFARWLWFFTSSTCVLLAQESGSAAGGGCGLGHRDEGAPPGQGPEGTAALAAALDSYVKAQTGQTSNQAGATSERSGLDANVKEVADLCREIQHAVDLLWPADKKTHVGIRKAFGLPVNIALR